MKIRKTRIKKVTKANGSVKYNAEYKWGLWWYQFDDLMGPGEIVRDIYFSYNLDARLKGEYHLPYSEKQAKEIIDFYIAMVKHLNACEIENEVVMVEYEGYP